MGRKHCGKRRNCSLRAISPFPTVVLKDFLLKTRKKTRACLGKGLSLASELVIVPIVSKKNYRFSRVILWTIVLTLQQADFANNVARQDNECNVQFLWHLSKTMLL